MFICTISVFNRYGKQLLDEMLQPHSLDWRDLVAILVLEQIPGASQSRLIPFLQTDKANVTKILKALEEKGLINRKVNPQDKRNRACSLTEQGQSLAPKLYKVLQEWEAICFQGIPEAEVEQFKATSEKITKTMMADQSFNEREGQ